VASGAYRSGRDGNDPNKPVNAAYSSPGVGWMARRLRRPGATARAEGGVTTSGGGRNLAVRKEFSTSSPPSKTCPAPDRTVGTTQVTRQPGAGRPQSSSASLTPSRATPPNRIDAAKPLRRTRVPNGPVHARWASAVSTEVLERTGAPRAPASVTVRDAPGRPAPRFFCPTCM
jgi:hypothetical protein